MGNMVTNSHLLGPTTSCSSSCCSYL